MLFVYSSFKILNFSIVIKRLHLNSFLFAGTSLLFSIESVSIYIPTNSTQGFPLYIYIYTGAEWLKGGILSPS